MHFKIKLFSRQKIWSKKYLPDIIILGGLFWYLLFEFKEPIAAWNWVDGQLKGDFIGIDYAWNKILPIMVIAIGLNIAIRRWNALRRKSRNT